jgi:hypothetical protein
MSTGSREGQLFDLAFAGHKHFEDHCSLVASLAGDQGVFGDRIPAIERGGFMHKRRFRALACFPERSQGRGRGFL